MATLWRRARLVTVRLRQLVLWVAIWMVLYWKPTMGMAALPLRWLGFSTWHRLAVDSDRIRARYRARQIPSPYREVCAGREYHRNGSNPSVGSRQQEAGKSRTHDASDLFGRSAGDFTRSQVESCKGSARTDFRFARELYDGSGAQHAHP